MSDTAPIPDPTPVADIEPAGPASAGERVQSLDVLRGVALLGILVVNVQIFAMIEAVLFNPGAYGNLRGIDLGVWLLTRIGFDQKFMTLFSALFGAGIALMAERGMRRDARPARRHYRRMFWLAVFGLMHGYLLWYGDILFLYAVCGSWVYLLRRLSPRWLIPIGVLVLSVGASLSLLTGLTIPHWPDEARQEMLADVSPDDAAIAAELEIYRGGWSEQMEHRAPTFLEFSTFVLLFWGLWRASGLMLIGMALLKLRFFHARWSARAYGLTATLGLGVGLTIVGGGVVRNWERWAELESFFFGQQYNYWGSLGVSLGYAALVMLWCRRANGEGRLQRAFAAVGRMALTNYLTHTIVCTTIFYGHGLGLFGRVERSGQLAIVVGIWIVQLVVSPWWLARFRFGPFEWLWRTLTYMERQPLRRV